jgi:ribosomal RNA-processing protein 7
MEYNSNIVNPVELQKEIDEYMAEYDKKVAEEEARLKAASQPDEDGWVTVTKK